MDAKPRALTDSLSSSSSNRLRGLSSLARFLAIAVALGLIAAGGYFAITHRNQAQLIRDGRRLLNRQQTADAWRVAEELRSRRPNSPEAWEFIAQAAERADRFDEQMAALARLVEVDTGHATEHWIQAADTLMQRNRTAAADLILRQALAGDPDHIGALRLRAQLTSVLGRSQELAECLLQLIRRQAFTVSDLAILAATDPFVADPDRLEAILQASPDDRQPNLAKARIALNADRTDEAEALLAELVARDWENLEAQALLGKLLAVRSDEEFLEWQRRLPRFADRNSRIWLTRGEWLIRQGELESGCRCLWEALLREPELLPATTQLARGLKLKAETEASEQFADRGGLLQEIRDLATRIDDQRSLRWAPELMGKLERAGRLWEAWAWNSVLIASQPGNAELRSHGQQLSARLSPDLPRTIPEALPGRHLNWANVPLPDWSKFGASAKPDEVAVAPSQIRFDDDAEVLGLRFTHANRDDPTVPGRFIFESTGSGVAALDYDLDGWTDIYFPQAGPWPVVPETAPCDVLFRNQRGGGFENVTATAHIVETAYSQGVAVGDYDNDGFPDLYVANLGRNTLLHNNGDGTFTDVTAASGLDDELWTVSAAIADLNLDGLPDLFDVNYLDGREALTTVCLNDRKEPRVCRPTIFAPAIDNVAINQGDGTFVNLKGEAGLDVPHGPGLGLVVADFNGDARPDVFVANDQAPNHLLLNEPAAAGESVRFNERGIVQGVALDRDGFALAFMGIACGDVNLDGRPDLFVTTFAQESNVLFLSQPDGSFLDQTREAGLRAPSFALLGFGTQFLDADCDGWQDLIVLNGHIDEFSFEGQEYRMRPQCFRGLPGARFTELMRAGSFFERKRLGRGLALLDWNRDGRQDFVASDLEDPVVLGTNKSETNGRALRLRCIGTASNRDAVGSRVRVVVAPGLERHLQIVAGDGYESASERTLHVGIGPHDHVARIEIQWPSGKESIYENVAVNEVWFAVEGEPNLLAQPR